MSRVIGTELQRFFAKSTTGYLLHCLPSACSLRIVRLVRKLCPVPGFSASILNVDIRRLPSLQSLLILSPLPPEKKPWKHTVGDGGGTGVVRYAPSPSAIVPPMPLQWSPRDDRCSKAALGAPGNAKPEGPTGKIPSNNGPLVPTAEIDSFLQELEHQCSSDEQLAVHQIVVHYALHYAEQAQRPETELAFHVPGAAAPEHRKRKSPMKLL